LRLCNRGKASIERPNDGRPKDRVIGQHGNSEGDPLAAATSLFTNAGYQSSTNITSSNGKAGLGVAW
jgi:hypothetical protein